ncbi:MAG: GIY-YIG nuclease family protein [Polyangiaceae bacterium]
MGSAAKEVWFVYLARCADGSIYTGIARDVAERLAKHDAGKGAKYTRGRGPLVLGAVRRCRSKGEALRLELAVKALAREKKEALTKPRKLAAFARAVAAAKAT